MSILALKWQPELGWPLSAFMVMCVIVMGFIAVMYIGKQADLDKFLKVAAMGLDQSQALAGLKKDATTPTE